MLLPTISTVFILHMTSTILGLILINLMLANLLAALGIIFTNYGVVMILETIVAVTISLLFADNLILTLSFLAMTTGGVLIYFLADYVLQEFFGRE